MNTAWCVYIVRCADHTLYTGITNNISRRLQQHNGELKGGARYTRGRQPVTLVYQCKLDSRSQATQREIEIKKMSKNVKKRLISDAISTKNDE